MRQSSAVRAVPRPAASSATPRPKDGPQPITGGRVFVVDDDASVRKSLERLLSSVGYRVQTFESARDFLGRPQAPADGPQCLILDIRMPGISGLDLQTSLRSSGANIPIIFSTGFGDVTSSVRAMKIGAVDFLTKPIDEEELLAAVERGLMLDAEMRRVDALMMTLTNRQSRLTPRENQVFGLVVTGMLNKQIAGRLGTCERTIKVHRARIMKKMEANSVADLVRMADRLGVPPMAPAATAMRRVE
ncbi:MAG TPA: response regulator [Gemmatimonadales bacterium]|nr:response regulator [Gemmatimonadales bacterium]